MRSAPTPLLRFASLSTFFFSLLVIELSADTVVPNNFKCENLIAWCVVPFDSKKRTPLERAAMLERLGLKRCAYDWRKEHIPEFEAEIQAYQKHGIDYFAFWGRHQEAYPLFRDHQLKPQIWRTLRSPKSSNQEDSIKLAAESLRELAQTTKEQGLALGLYNHGGWGGVPTNMVAVCLELHRQGFHHVGIVYNFHHAHHELEKFAENLDAMKPYLLCLNLNGMTHPDDPDFQKIRPIGSGNLEEQLIRTIIASAYKGPIGILGHVADRDAEVVLEENLNGLDSLLKALP